MPRCVMDKAVSGRVVSDRAQVRAAGWLWWAAELELEASRQRWTTPRERRLLSPLRAPLPTGRQPYRRRWQPAWPWWPPTRYRGSSLRQRSDTTSKTGFRELTRSRRSRVCGEPEQKALDGRPATGPINSPCLYPHGHGGAVVAWRCPHAWSVIDPSTILVSCVRYSVLVVESHGSRSTP